jgi:hypothetical protein
MIGTENKPQILETALFVWVEMASLSLLPCQVTDAGRGLPAQPV